MYNINLSTPIHIHFTGIGGISMSGLAEILAGKGFTVSGSDMKESDITRALVSLGIAISYKQDADAIPEGCDVLVYTAAMRPDHPELEAARKRNIPLLTRAQLLGQMMKFYKLPIAISGTHGKTTTTSMLSEILLKAGTDPTLSIGGILPSIGGNIRAGGGDFFVTEACEYTDSFLSFFPVFAAILNIEEDHLDYFPGLSAIIESFRRFACLLPKDGVLVMGKDINGFSKIRDSVSCRVITFGSHSDCDYYYTGASVIKDGNDNTLFTFNLKNSEYGDDLISLRLPGEHNILNALAAIALADALGIKREDSISALSGFTGSLRRFQYKGSFNGVSIIDDYAHHPTEISSTLKAAKDYPHNELWCVFQSHTYTRTKALLDDFAKALLPADHVIIQKIYPARETDDLGISNKTLAEAMEKSGAHPVCHDTFEETVTFLKNNCHPGDLVITMGAGDVVNIGDMILNQ